ncbi:MAG: hypothetical protein KGJ13_02445 [Patescibacteria group bacterium]|nr:hypothetical protein [Patescibacteria group bacterium]
MAANNFPGNPNPPAKVPDIPAPRGNGGQGPQGLAIDSGASTGDDLPAPSAPNGRPQGATSSYTSSEDAPWTFAKNDDGTFQAYTFDPKTGSKDMGSVAINDADKVLHAVGTFNPAMDSWEVPAAAAKQLAQNNLPLPAYLKDKFNLGSAEVAQGAIGQQFLNGQMSADEAVSRGNPGILKAQMAQAPGLAWNGNLGDFVGGLWNTVKDAWSPRNVAGQIAEMAPSLMDMGKQAVGYGSVVGLGVGLTAGPEAAPAGFAVGAGYGIWKSVSDISAGQSAVGMLAKGYDEKTVKTLAPLEGALNGLMMVGTADLLSVPGLKSYVDKAAANSELMGKLAKYVAGVAGGTSLMAAQTAVHETMDHIAATVDNMPAAADRQPMAAIIRSAITSAPVMAALGLPGTLIGEGGESGFREETPAEQRSAAETEKALQEFQEARKENGAQQPIPQVEAEKPQEAAKSGESAEAVARAASAASAEETSKESAVTPEQAAHELMEGPAKGSEQPANGDEILGAVEKAAEKPPKPTLEQQTRDVETQGRIDALQHDLKDSETLLDHLSQLRDDYVRRGIPTRKLDGKINSALADWRGTKEDLDFYQAPFRENAMVMPHEHLWMKPATLEDIVNTAEEAGRQGTKERAQQIKDLASENKLTRLDTQKFLKSKPWSVMGERQFDNFLGQFKEHADEVNERKEAMRNLQIERREKQLGNEQYIRQLHDLPPMRKMDTDQIREYTRILKQYDKGDEALSPKRIASLDTTALKGAKTQKEVMDLAGKLTGQPIKDMMQVRIPLTAQITPDADLEKINGVLKFVVAQDKTIGAKTDALAEGEKNIGLELAAKALKSRRALMDRGERIADWFAPQQDSLKDYIEAQNPAKEAQLAKKLTPEELEWANWWKKIASGFEDYLTKNDELNTRFSGHYVPHIVKPWPEIIRDVRKVGLWNSLKEFLPSKDDAKFADMDNRRVSLREFFEPTQFRSGKLDPSKNIYRAASNYIDAFYKKVHYDELAPLVTTMVQAAKWADREAPEGENFNKRLETFLGQYLNKVKGDTKFTNMEIEGMGNKILGAANSWAALHYIALNVPLQSTVLAAEKASAWMITGPEAFARAQMRRFTDQGQAILSKYETFTGESPVEQLKDPTKNFADTVNTALYGTYQWTRRNALQDVLLGSLTKEEFEKGEISPERLGEIKRAAARWMPMPDMSSVVGKSLAARSAFQLVQWAIPPFRRAVEDLGALAKTVASGGEKKLTPDQIHDFARAVGPLTLALTARRLLTPQMEDSSFEGRLIHYLRRHMIAMFSAMDPSVFYKPFLGPRLVLDTAQQLETLMHVERSKARGWKGGALEGENGLIKDLEPAMLRQLGVDFGTNEDERGKRTWR